MGSNPIISATSEWTLLHSDFLFHKKSVITLRHSSSSAKGHVRVGYLLASALITPLAHYQPFAVCALRRSCFPCSSFSVKSHVCFGYAFASARITPPLHYQLFTGYAPYGAVVILLLLFRKNDTHITYSLASAFIHGSLSLPPFCSMRLTALNNCSAPLP